MEQTLDKLSLVDMYYWPGLSGEEPVSRTGFPFPPSYGERDVEHLMSNRRVLKAYQELGALPKPDAGKLVNRQLEKAVEGYDRLLGEFIKENGPFYPPTAQNPAGPGFVIGNTDKPTLIGAKLQILALVLLAGNLELRDSAPAVLGVAKRATEQYEQFQADRTYHLNFRFQILKKGSLYNRQALAVGLLGTMSKRDDPVVTKYQGRLSSKMLTHFDARKTPYDAAAQLGMVDVDYPQQPLRLRYLQELSDADLKEIIGAASKW
jgi:hypothetical protein